MGLKEYSVNEGVVCELVLVGSCVLSILLINYGSKSPTKYAFFIHYIVLAVTATIGAVRFGLPEESQTPTIVQLHKTATSFTSNFGIMGLFIGTLAITKRLPTLILWSVGLIATILSISCNVLSIDVQYHWIYLLNQFVANVIMRLGLILLLLLHSMSCLTKPSQRVTGALKLLGILGVLLAVNISKVAPSGTRFDEKDWFHITLALSMLLFSFSVIAQFPKKSKHPKQK
eukprot:TRINITY_DN1029_c7_g1_i1.p1 TRINITY_DN1029_c7_g1~~TRINITY_DN1029_c7_g1_i1.p1  ORF type:complete len:230 (+),score=39.96 TRINITY_DN1029_c7_g1_i1:75-764(+)